MTDWPPGSAGRGGGRRTRRRADRVAGRRRPGRSRRLRAAPHAPGRQRTGPGRWPAPRPSPAGPRCCGTPCRPRPVWSRPSSPRPPSHRSPFAPRSPVSSDRLGRQRLVPALRSFAAELADPTGDLVVAALVLAAGHEARRLAELLGSLAGAARDQAAMQLRIEAGRARIRTSTRVVTGSTLCLRRRSGPAQPLVPLPFRHATRTGRPGGHRIPLRRRLLVAGPHGAAGTARAVPQRRRQPSRARIRAAPDNGRHAERGADARDDGPDLRSWYRLRDPARRARLLPLPIPLAVALDRLRGLDRDGDRVLAHRPPPTGRYGSRRRLGRGVARVRTDWLPGSDDRWPDTSSTCRCCPRRVRSDLAVARSDTRAPPGREGHPRHWSGSCSSPPWPGCWPSVGPRCPG